VARRTSDQLLETLDVKKYIVATAFALTALFVVDVSASPAEAQGIHYRSRGVHIDIGSAHRHGHRHHGRRRYSGRRWHGGWGGHHSDWHDTTHLDYHPGEFVPHYDHYHYVPGHIDVHRSGHWDSHF
jgi:hypothetical protein